MGDRCRGRSIWRRTHARLIGEQALFNAGHDRAARKPAGNRLRVKRLRKDRLEDAGHSRQMGHNHDKADQNVSARHDRNNDRGDKADAVHASEDDKPGQDGQHDADNHWPQAAVKVRDIVLDCGRNVVSLQAIEAVGKAGNEQDRKQAAQPAFAQTALDIVGGPAAERVAVLDLIDLCECGLDKRRRAANDRHQPHPEYCSRPACRNRGGNTGNVARTHARSGRNHQCLERGYLLDPVFIPGFLAQDPDDVPNSPDLHKPGADGKIDARANQQENQDVGIHKIVQTSQVFVQHFIPPNFSLSSRGIYHT